MIGLVLHPPSCLTLSPTTKYGSSFKNSLFISKPFSPRTCSFKFCRIKNDGTHEPFEDFSVLKSDIPYDSGSIWSTMALYIFSLHIPVSFGGLSVVAETLHQNVLDPQTEALSLLLLQSLELIGVFLLLRYTAKPQYNLLSFGGVKEVRVPNERNWLVATALGFGFLIVLGILISLVADRVVGPKDVNNPILKEILSSGFVSIIACTLIYCIATPVLEETIYRGFLLASLASTMDWQKAVIISSAIFSAAHFSVENSIQLFIIGTVLGCSYCWTGKLSSPILIHSLYNALILFITFTA